MSGVSFISNQAMEGKCLSIALGILSYFFGVAVFKGNGLGNKPEVILIAHHVVMCG